MADKIRLLSDQPDVTNYSKLYKKGDVLDLGIERNKIAVANGKAEWVKSEVKKESDKSREKVESPKKTTSSVKGKKIETK